MPEVQEARHLLQSDNQRQKSVYDRKPSHEVPTLDAGDRVLIQADKDSSVWLQSIVVENVTLRALSAHGNTHYTDNQCRVMYSYISSGHDCNTQMFTMRRLTQWVLARDCLYVPVRACYKAQAWLFW